MTSESHRFKVVRLSGRSIPLLPEEKEHLDAIGAGVVLVEGETAESIRAAAHDADAILVSASKIRADLIRDLARCRIISRMGTGVDNIDIQAATEHGIVVTNLPSFGTVEMAEHTMAFVLALARKLPEADEIARRGAWSRRGKLGLHRLQGRTLGLVGFGRTARAVAVRAGAFGLNVIGYHHRRSPGEVVDGVPMASLEELLRESDFVSLHVPLTEKTYHMFAEAEFRLMKPTAYLINTSRGAVVDEAALVKALEEKWIAGAAIDVYEGVDVFFSPDAPPEHPLFRFRNVLLSPHIAAASVEAGRDGHALAAKQVRDVLSGFWPPHVVNPNVVPRYPLARPPEE